MQCVVQDLQTLGFQIGARHREPGQVSAGPGQALDEAVSDRVVENGEHDGRAHLGIEQEANGLRSRRDDDVDIAHSEIGRMPAKDFGAALAPEILHLDVLAVDQAVFGEARPELLHIARIDRYGALGTQIDDDRYRTGLLLRAGRERQQRGRTEACDEFPPPHSITSSATASKVGGTAMPSPRAVLRLIAKTNLLACTTGRSAGLAPPRIFAA